MRRVSVLLVRLDSALFDRFFAFFRNVDPGNASKSDGADKHRGGAGGDGGASYLMGTSSMYSPLMRRGVRGARIPSFGRGRSVSSHNSRSPAPSAASPARLGRW